MRLKGTIIKVKNKIKGEDEYWIMTGEEERKFGTYYNTMVLIDSLTNGVKNLSISDFWQVSDVYLFKMIKDGEAEIVEVYNEK